VNCVAVHYNGLQCVAACCSILQRVVVTVRVLPAESHHHLCCHPLECLRCSVLQSVTVLCSVLQCVTVVLQCCAMLHHCSCCHPLVCLPCHFRQCVAVCCRMLQYVAWPAVILYYVCVYLNARMNYEKKSTCSIFVLFIL